MAKDCLPCGAKARTQLATVQTPRQQLAQRVIDLDSLKLLAWVHKYPPTHNAGAEWMVHLAHANAAIAGQEWRRALEPLAQAEALAMRMKLGRVRVEAMALRAFALDRCGEKAVVVLREAIDLANTFGLVRLFRDAHPGLGEWVERVQAERTRGAEAPRSEPAAPAASGGPARVAAAPRATPSQALTPKEREVLELLARNLSNKEIALAMQIGEETIKWHLKNLFGKLAAGTRKQVVRRAQLLGLLETA